MNKSNLGKDRLANSVVLGGLNSVDMVFSFLSLSQTRSRFGEVSLSWVGWCPTKTHVSYFSLFPSSPQSYH